MRTSEANEVILGPKLYSDRTLFISECIILAGTLCSALSDFIQHQYVWVSSPIFIDTREAFIYHLAIIGKLSKTQIRHLNYYQLCKCPYLIFEFRKILGCCESRVGKFQSFAKLLELLL